MTEQVEIIEINHIIINLYVAMLSFRNLEFEILHIKYCIYFYHTVDPPKPP